MIYSQPSGEVGRGLGILGSAKWRGSHGLSWELFARYLPSPSFSEVFPSEKTATKTLTFDGSRGV